MDISLALRLLPGLVIGLTFHEASHAFSAQLLGDANPQRMGRISLNPLRHLSPLGTLALFILHFGWGRPVEVNIFNFKKPRVHYLLTSLAGPAANLLLCCCAVLFMFIFRGNAAVMEALLFFYYINAMLALINLIPIPPLDGSKIWPCLIPWLRPVISRRMSFVWMIMLLGLLYTGIIEKGMTYFLTAVSMPLVFFNLLPL
ncbi:MAG: site-2 protease family protein [Spirochaetales bacterium]|nr:site-2 protease family protein [Spirochaetales bacterium]